MRIVYPAFFVMAALVVVSLPALAAESSVSPLALGKGTQALQFEISYNFKLSPFQGATISCERFLRDRLALRLGIEASTDYNDDEQVVHFEGDTVGEGRIGLTYWHHQYSLVCQLVSYRKGPVAFCYGAGPRVTYSSDQHEDGYFYEDGGVIQSHHWTDWRRVWGVGVGGFAGVQWLATDRFRLHAEYSTAVMYGHEDKTHVDVYAGQDNLIETVTDDNNVLGIYPGGTRLGLSVSF